MGLFSTSEQQAKARTRQLTRVEPAAEDARVVAGEQTQRRNVPAVALGNTAKRPTISLPSPSASYRAPDQVGERKLMVGRDISLAGEIAECDHLVVEGTMDATLRQGNRLEIYPSGLYRGAANVKDAEIAGRFEGDLSVSGRLRIRAGGQVSGRIQYAEIEVEPGAQISGEFTFVAAPTQTAANDTTVLPFNNYAATGTNG